MISSLIFLLLWLAVALLIVTAALSPIETLSWWAGWTDEELDEDTPKHPPLTSLHKSQQTFVVYLSGVGSMTGRVAIPRERYFIKALRKALPDATVVADVFPYSPAGLPLLSSPRVFDRLWRRIQMTRLKGRRALFAALINIRNIFQVMVSADHRYGPIFGQGAASVIETSLLNAGYQRGSNAQVIIIGYSGGAQVAIGAAGFLKARLGATIDIISVGGVMASDPGLHFVRRLYHLYGDNDHIQRIGAIMFPERWSAMAHSEWNKAKRERRIIMTKMDNMIHAGPRGYFGLPKQSGVSNADRTLKAVVQIIQGKPADYPRESGDPNHTNKLYSSGFPLLRE